MASLSDSNSSRYVCMIQDSVCTSLVEGCDRYCTVPRESWVIANFNDSKLMSFPQCVMCGVHVCTCILYVFVIVCTCESESD